MIDLFPKFHPYEKIAIRHITASQHHRPVLVCRHILNFMSDKLSTFSLLLVLVWVSVLIMHRNGIHDFRRRRNLNENILMREPNYPFSKFESGQFTVLLIRRHANPLSFRQIKKMSREINNILKSTRRTHCERCLRSFIHIFIARLPLPEHSKAMAGEQIIVNSNRMKM